MKAAVLHDRGKPLTIEEVDLAPPQAGEVKVRIVATGVCHSDLSVVHGVIPSPLPVVLGHEAAGVVEEVGSGVAGLAPGDKVVLCFAPPCGECWYCRNGRLHLCERAIRLGGGLFDGTSRLSLRGGPLHHFSGVSSFAQYAVVPASGAIKVRPDAPLETVCLVGCCVATGVGAVVNTARVRPGSTVAVYGCGGVGLNIVQGAHLAGASMVIAVDLVEGRLEVARRLGATHLIHAGEEDPVRRIRALTNRQGVDYAFEAIGKKETAMNAFNSTRRGGMTVIVGVPPREVELPIPVLWLFQEKVVTGSFYGSIAPARDFPLLVDLYMAGRLKLEEIITARLPLEGVNDAFAMMEQGEGARTVLHP